jgi:hypothetical protein
MGLDVLLYLKFRYIRHARGTNEGFEINNKKIKGKVCIYVTSYFIR